MKKKKKHYNKGTQSVAEIMEEMDVPGGGFNLTEQFMEQGASAAKASQTLLNAFRSTFEPVASEHMTQEYFTMGRLREYFQAWIVPKMPDPLPVYLEELDYMGYTMRTSFDGSPCIMVRYRGAVDVPAEEVVSEEEVISEDEEEPFVYTDDWENEFASDV